jgi:hypothetical protein
MGVGTLLDGLGLGWAELSVAAAGTRVSLAPRLLP